mgnify:CR=1 FL=1
MPDAGSSTGAPSRLRGNWRRSGEAFFAKNGGTWPAIEDTDGKIATDFGVTGVPESYLIDPNGIVRAKIVGGVVADKLEQLLAQAKAQSS